MEVTLGTGYGWNAAANNGKGGEGYCHVFADWMPSDDVPAGTLTVTGGEVLHKGNLVSQWGSPGFKLQLAARLFTYVDSSVGDDYVDYYWKLAEWGDPRFQPAVVSGGEEQRFTQNGKTQIDVTCQWGYEAPSATPKTIASARTYVSPSYNKPMGWFGLFLA